MATVKPYDTAAGKRYRVRYRKPDHSQTDKRGFKTKKEAELFAASVEVGMATGNYIDPKASRVTVAVLGDAWLNQQGHLKPSAYRSLESAWRVHVRPKWGSTGITSIRHTEVAAWVTMLGETKSATTVIRAYGVLAAVLDGAVKDRRLPANPARGVSLPRKVKKQRVYLSHAQVEALATESKDKATLVRTLAYTGLRWGEATGLRVRDVDQVRHRFNVTLNAVDVGGRIIVGTPKTHASRSVPYPEFLYSEISTAAAEKPLDALLFGDGLDHLRQPHAIRGWFVGAARAARSAEADFPTLTIHDLRHTAASLAISAGANVKAVQRMLGHASAAMTLDTYADLFDDDLDTVSSALHNARSLAVVGN